MRRVERAWVVAAYVAAILCSARPAHAWGFDLHRFITDRALALVPAGLQPFYRQHRVFLTEHSVDPDLWRTAGFEEEPPRHYIDLDAYGSWPFRELPRDHELAVAKFGRAKIHENGLLPWRAAEMYAELVESFVRHRRGTSRWALENAIFFSAAVSHYVADAHMPLHTVRNHDGQLTGQEGLHSRFETDLVGRFRDQLRLAPPAVAPVRTMNDYMFETLVDTFRGADGVLRADREAIGTGTLYDDAYFARFFERTRPILERQLSRAIAAVAAVWTGAWEMAGRPDLSAPSRPARTRKAARRQQ
jgi:hypothetical protein